MIDEKEWELEETKHSLEDELSIEEENDTSFEYIDLLARADILSQRIEALREETSRIDEGNDLENGSSIDSSCNGQKDKPIPNQWYTIKEIMEKFAHVIGMCNKFLRILFLGTI